MCAQYSPVETTDRVSMERYSSSHVIPAAEEVQFDQNPAHMQTSVKHLIDRPRYYTSAHKYDLNTLEIEYNTSINNGLTMTEVLDRLNNNGYNEIDPAKHSKCSIFLKYYFFTFINILLLFICILCIVISCLILNNSPYVKSLINCIIVL